MWTLINATKSNQTVGDLNFRRGDRHVVVTLTDEIIAAVNSNKLYCNPPMPAMTADLVDDSGGTASDTIDEITEAGNAGSADTGPTADAIASITAAVNNLKSVVAARL